MVTLNTFLVDIVNTLRVYSSLKYMIKMIYKFEPKRLKIDLVTAVCVKTR